MDDEKEWVKRLREGNLEALEHLIKSHHAFLVGIVIPLVGRESANDVAQETWLRAVNAVGSFEGRSKFRTWLARIAINEAHSMRRKLGREISLEWLESEHHSPISSQFDEHGAWTNPPDKHVQESPEELLTEIELYECIWKYIQELPSAQRSVVIMRDIAGLEYKEIAHALALSEGNVRLLLHRGRQRIQVMLSDFQEEGKC
ncbi:RNA polymerase sigma factor [Pseudomonas auratipiscis]|uniref:RNA polymerase sigma factor n=1 Tax=Pseudomonas auratipiscis TaxID=3115853 RepID=A0AB35WPG7_9PSED|nr:MULTISPECIES: RNA polymerase sigma factor [unclassified Pseudomonas]MEE1864966.1 RNA polymerase sigma factor [Pseudomonas sp. 120P]MEE1956093.1 RNA polymerase sigma factor [Pseudomonas sp. 119P]